MTQQRPKTGLVGSYVEKVKQRLLSMVYYAAADQSLLQLNEQGWRPTETSSRIPVLVLSRACYQEKLQSFAIRSASELRKVLKQSEQGKLSFHFISKLEQGQRRVLTIMPYPEYWPLCQKATLVLPASVVLASGIEPGLHQLQSPDKQLFILKYPGGDWHSALATPVMKQPQSALLLLGGHPETQCYSWTEQQLPELIRQGLFKLLPEYWLSGWNGFQSSASRLPWQMLVSSCAAVSIVYLLCSTVYLEATSYYRQHKLQQGGEEMTELLSERQQLQQKQQLTIALQQQLSDVYSTQQVWDLISVLQLNDIDVQRLQWFGEEVQLTAEAENATQALQMILDQPFVSSAQFISPVRKAQRKEMLTAAIEFRKYSSKESDTEPAKTTNSETGTEGISND